MLASGTASTAIKTVGLGRFMHPSLDMNSVSSQLVWQHLTSILRGARNAAPDIQAEHTGIAGYWGLKDISLDIERGSCVCLTGPSGSGKSVLLQVLARQLPPTAGRVEIHGTVSRLLSIGENLDNELSGIENIAKHSKLIDTPPGERQRHIRDIIAFAELEQFENIQVRRYSTGMAMRLSMAIALHGDPDILLIDDILGVGDIGFQHRIVERLLALRDAGCTTVLALGDDALIRQLATRVITLRGGTIVGDEPPAQVLIGQRGFGASNVWWKIARLHPENYAVALQDVVVTDVVGKDGAELDIRLEYDIKLAPQICRPAVSVVCDKGRVFHSLYPANLEIQTAQPLQLSVRVPIHLLAEGTYQLATSFPCLLQDGAHLSLNHPDAVTLEVRRDIVATSGTSSPPLTTPHLTWKVERFKGGK